MKVLKILGLFLFTALLVLLIPLTQEKIYEKLINHYLKMDTKVLITQYSPYHYALQITLDNNATLELSLHHNLTMIQMLELKFIGDIAIFSNLTPQKIPHQEIDFSSTLVNVDNRHLIGKAELTTHKERLSLSHIRVDKMLSDIHAHYALNIKELSDTSYPLPTYLKGALSTEGELSYIKEVASLSSDIVGGVLNIIYDEKNVALRLDNSDIQKILRFSPKSFPLKNGLIDLYLAFKTPALLKGDINAMQGSIDANLSALTLQGINLNQSISKLVATQNLSLCDHDKNSTQIKQQARSDDNSTYFSNIRLFVTLKNAQVRFNDVAISTDKHLIAINGGLDFKQSRFKSVELGIVDTRKCAYYVQPIEGTFDELDISFAKAGMDVLSGSVLSLGSNLGDLTHSGGKLFSSIADYTASAVDGATAYVPVVKDHAHYLSDSLTAVGDKGKNLTAQVSSQTCTPFYLGALRHP